MKIFQAVRHGNRSPKHTYETDPYNDISFWPDGFNQLTEVGKQQTYELGHFLRRRYGELLGSDDVVQNVSIQSASEDRCLMSAQCAAAGLFQQNNWYDDVFAVHVSPDQENCDEIKEMAYKFLESSEIKALLWKYRKLRHFIQFNSKSPVKTVNDFIKFNDALNVERSQNLRYGFFRSFFCMDIGY